MKHDIDALYNTIMLKEYDGYFWISVFRLYYELFGYTPNFYEVTLGKTNEITCINTIPKDPDKEDDADYIADLKDLLSEFSDKPYYLFLFNGYKHIIIGDSYILVILKDFGNPNMVDEIKVLANNESIVINEIIPKLPKARLEKENEVIYKYVTYSNNGFDASDFTVKENYDIDIVKNYNDDIPYQDLIDFCNNDGNGLVLLHGTPGCGKTTIIKNLIRECKDVWFYLLDASLLGDITSSTFLQFLLSCKDSVFVLEDCEKLLVDRNTTHNPLIGTLLNLTDGMLGEGLNIKFICTFNSDMNYIDKALLREGRLKICYEFKPLCLEKSKVLCKELNKECNKAMTLAEIYKTKTVYSSLNKTSKIGF